jgi:DNA-binding response OmpR family regulator
MQPRIEPKLWQALTACDVATHEDLENAIWGDCLDPPVEQRAMIQQRIARIRRKLPPGMALVAVRGIGYAVRPRRQPAAVDRDLLTASEERLMRALVRFDTASCAYIEQALWSDRLDPPTNPRVFIAKLVSDARKKIRNKGWKIASVYGVGYALQGCTRAQVREWLDAHNQLRIDRALVGLEKERIAA